MTRIDSLASRLRDLESNSGYEILSDGTLQAKEDEVAFLRGHVAQLTQSFNQLSLKPGEEEIQKKGWSWRFWK